MRRGDGMVSGDTVTIYVKDEVKAWHASNQTY
jgi:hypothetical protein